MLIEIDPRAYQAARDQAQGSLQVAEAQLADARDRTWTRRGYRRRRRLAAAQAQLVAAQASQFKARRTRGGSAACRNRRRRSRTSIPPNAALRTADAQVEQAQAAVRQADMVPQFVGAGRSAGAPARGAGGAGPGAARTGGAEPVLDQGDARRRTAGSPSATSSRATTCRRASRSCRLVTPEVWVTANFKESQLDRMRPGEQVDIGVDAYPRPAAGPATSTASSLAPARASRRFRRRTPPATS